MSGQYIYDMIVNKWRVPKDVKPSFKGQNVIVTGANVGLGYDAALKFVQLGASKVILGVRTITKGEEAKRKIEQSSGRANVVEVWQLDMLNYDSIKAFAKKADTELEQLHAVCLNAGVHPIEFQLSDYGYELALQVNVLSTALLALLLLPKMKASKTSTFTPSLEIVGSSNSYLMSKFTDESAPLASRNKEGCTGPGQYSYSKVFVNYIEESLMPLVQNKQTGKPDVFLVVVCPGACDSELARDAKGALFEMAKAIMRALIMRTNEQGARTYISGIAEGEKTHGKFWKDDTVRPPPALSQGKKGRQLAQAAWKEITAALMQYVPEVEQLAAL